MSLRPAHRIAPVVAVSLAIGLAACSETRGARSSDNWRAVARTAVPVRAKTAGDVLLDKLPAGADSLVEIDLARLRANPVVGGLATTLMRAGKGADSLGLSEAALDTIDLVLFASYDLGTKSSATLTVVRGAGVGAWHRGHRLDATTVALGRPGLIARVRAVTGGARSLANDHALLAVRSRAMPANADAAAVRVSARLDFDARVSLSSALSLEQVPTSVSVWGDVVDDLAIVGLFGATTAKHAAKLTTAVTRWRNKVAADIAAGNVGLGFIVRRTRVERQGGATRALLHLGPQRLQRYVSRFTASNK